MMLDPCMLALLGNAPAGLDRTFWMPEQASTVAAEIDWIFHFINVLCYFFFVVIIGSMLWFMVRYRRRGHVPQAAGPTHNTPLEVTWTVVPLVLVIVMFYVGMRGYLDLQTPPTDAYEIRVTAQKWSWTFEHPKYGTTQSGELTVPVGRPVRLVLASQDVIHSLFVPAFRVKQDVVPGRYTNLWFEATRTGDFQLLCTEYCGKDHSRMLAMVHVLPEAEFEAEIMRLAREYEDMPDEMLPDYAIRRIYPRCASCHSLDGTSGTGPSFTGLWQRTLEGTTIFTDGTAMADLRTPSGPYAVPENYIRESLLEPQRRIIMNYTGAMPTFKGQLRERQIFAVIEMLKHLDELVDEDGTILERNEE